MAKGGRSWDRVLGYATAVALALMMMACGAESDSPGATMESQADHSVLVTDAALSDTGRAGEEVFNANCSVCHGVGATGTERGPTLIHRIYHPRPPPGLQYPQRGRPRSEAAPLVLWKYGSCPWRVRR